MMCLNDMTQFNLTDDIYYLDSSSVLCRFMLIQLVNTSMFLVFFFFKQKTAYEI